VFGVKKMVNIYVCPKFGLMFGGNNLLISRYGKKKIVICPVCGGSHEIENNQIKKEHYGCVKNGNSGVGACGQ